MFCTGLLAALLLAAGGKHPNSVSQLDVLCHDGMVELELQVQGRTLVEVERLALDQNRDGGLTRAEVQAAWPAIAVYLQKGLTLEINGEAAPLDFALAQFEALPEWLGGEEAAGFERMVTRARVPVTARTKRLRIASGLFFDDGNPDHRMFVRVIGLDAGTAEHWLDVGRTSISVPPPKDAPTESAFLTYLSFGWEHVLEGYDHLAFLLALLFGVAGWRSLVAAVTAFTLAHSLTLGISAAGWLSLPPRIVEPGIALSILISLSVHVARGPERSRPWMLAGGFGLLHGFGFAGVLGDLGLPDDAFFTGLAAFNLGVEAGQLTFLLPVALVLPLLRNYVPAERASFWVDMFATTLGAFSIHWSASAITEGWLASAFAALPAELRLLPTGLAIGIAATLIAGKRLDARGQHLRLLPMFATAAWAFYLAGGWAAAALAT